MRQQHVEFFDRDHFEYNYFRKKSKGELSRFIDFFWETDFDALYERYPMGFSDALFPNIGYTYIVNLGTPCVMQLDDKKFELKTDCFLPRNCNMICHHSKGNKLFGIKFKVSPVVFEKRVDFSEYKDYIFPLAYLIDRNVITALKEAGGFDKRVQILSDHYNNIIKQHAGSLDYVDIVTDILDSYYTDHNFSLSVEDLAAKHKITSRTLQRYFEKATSISSKQALQIIRIRKAVEHLVTDAETFKFEDYGYYDHSHFYKHLKQFVTRTGINIDEPHLKLLNLQNKKKAP